MAGTIIITGANSSLAIPAVAYLLDKYPDYTAVLTVRNASDGDANTATLRAAISRYPQAKAVIRELDLAVLSAVHDFTDTISKNINNGKYPPIVAVVCNAFSWNLATGAPESTSDGYEKTFQVNHIAHASLVLRLLGQFDPTGGRIVSLSTEAHWPGKAVWEKIPPEIPSDVESLVKPPAEADYTGRPFQRYANSKLAIIMWTHALNRQLIQHPDLKRINAIAVDPGYLVDSRALRTNTTSMFVYAQKLFFRPFKPLLSLIDPKVRIAAEAGPDLIELALQRAHPNERGHFKLMNKEESSPDSLDTDKQNMLWAKTLEWAKVTSEEIGLTSTNP